MSLLIDHHAVSAAAGGASLVLTLGLGAWRFGLECERGWLRSEALDPAPFEEALFARMRAELGLDTERAAVEPARTIGQTEQLALAC